MKVLIQCSSSGESKIRVLEPKTFLNFSWFGWICTGWESNLRLCAQQSSTLSLCHGWTKKKNDRKRFIEEYQHEPYGRPCTRCVRGSRTCWLLCKYSGKHWHSLGLGRTMQALSSSSADSTQKGPHSMDTCTYIN